MPPGKVILLHGPSSSGKSTLARALQAKIELPFLHYSIDSLRDSGVLPLERAARGDFVWADMRAPFFDGFHRSVAAFAEAGNNLILEHILDTPGWLEQLAGLLARCDVFFVGIRCSVEELRRRELSRGDRPVGSAEADYNFVHNGMRYDFEVSSEDDLDTNVTRLLSAWHERGPRGVFAGLLGDPGSGSVSKMGRLPV